MRHFSVHTSWLVIPILLIVTACQTAQNAAPQACEAISIAYSAFVTAGVGSAKDKANVEAAYAAVTPICASPSTATPTQLAVVAVQLALIASTYKKVKRE